VSAPSTGMASSRQIVGGRGTDPVVAGQLFIRVSGAVNGLRPSAGSMLRTSSPLCDALVIRFAPGSPAFGCHSGLGRRRRNCAWTGTGRHLWRCPAGAPPVFRRRSPSAQRRRTPQRRNRQTGQTASRAAGQPVDTTVPAGGAQRQDIALEAEPHPDDRPGWQLRRHRRRGRRGSIVCCPPPNLTTWAPLTMTTKNRGRPARSPWTLIGQITAGWPAAQG
jgi:hypothetical protein